VKKLSFLNSRKFKYGSLATAITVIFLGIIIVFNLIIGSVSQRFQLSLDLTSKKVFNLTRKSIEFLDNLNKDIKIDVLNDEDAFSSSGEAHGEWKYYNQVDEILKQYQKHSKRVKIEYINLLKNPNYSKDYPKDHIGPNSIIVKSGSQHQVLGRSDLFEIESGMMNQRIVASKAEQALTSAILNVTTEDKIKISVINGYDEENYMSLQNLLKINSYEVLENKILTENISEDVKMIVIFAPNKDYTLADIEKLENFLKLGEKSIVYFPNPGVKKLPNLEGFLEKHNIKVEEGIVFETDTERRFSPQDVFNFVSQYSRDTIYTEGLKNIKTPNIYIPMCKPLKSLNSEQVEVLLETSKKSGIYTNQKEIAEKDFSGPIATALAANIKFEENPDKDSTILVFGSFGIAQEGLISRTDLNNSEYILNIYRILSGNEEQKISIEPKSLEGKELGIKADQTNIINLIFSVILPLTVLTIGVVIFIKRKNK